MKGLLLVTATVVVAYVAAVIFALFPGRHQADIWEKLTNESPEAKIAVYLQAVARGDAEGALLVWQLSGDEFYQRAERLRPLSDRRQKMTSDLVAAGVTADFTVLGIEWWKTCCWPDLVSDPRVAGMARVRVALRDRAGGQSVYVFDVLTRDEPYWTVDAYPPRAWVLRDVYLDGQDPLYWDHQATPVPAQ